jgi:hypothetical protein
MGDIVSKDGLRSLPWEFILSLPSLPAFLHKLRRNHTHPNGIKDPLGDCPIERALDLMRPVPIGLPFVPQLVQHALRALLGGDREDILLVEGHGGADFRWIQGENVDLLLVLVAECA